MQRAQDANTKSVPLQRISLLFYLVACGLYEAEILNFILAEASF